MEKRVKRKKFPGSTGWGAGGLLLGLLFAGCVAPTRQGAPASTPEELEALAGAVSRATAAGESTAREFARVALAGTAGLAERYELAYPPLWHNALVNAGLRERGLCHQFADDLSHHLAAGGPWPFPVRPVAARPDSYFRAHHALAVGRPGAPLAEWLILDPWRGAGKLRWSLAADDPTPWAWWSPPDS